MKLKEKIVTALKKSNWKLLSASEVARLVDVVFPGSSAGYGNFGEFRNQVQKDLTSMDEVEIISKEILNEINIKPKHILYALKKQNKKYNINTHIDMGIKICEAKISEMKETPEPNTIITGDNLIAMQKMADSCIDLIYLDPPYNSGADYKAAEDSNAAGSEFKDTWGQSDISAKDIKTIKKESPGAYKIINFVDENLNDVSMKAYLIFMTVRLLEMHRILKETGSIYLHVDTTSGHYLKLIMDAIFDRGNFRNEIAWCYTGPRQGKSGFGRQHDVILFYAKSKKTSFNTEAVRIKHKRQKPSSGRGMASGERTIDEIRENERQQIEKGKLCPDWWNDIGAGSHIPANERTGYPTQKPLKLLRRIILASSNEGDLVFDPFCGSGTTLVAASENKRKWIGCDLTSEAAQQTKDRIENVSNSVEMDLSPFFKRRNDNNRQEKFDFT